MKKILNFIQNQVNIPKYLNKMSQIVNMAKQTSRLVPQVTKQGKFPNINTLESNKLQNQ